MHIESMLAAIASRHLKPEHVDTALGHYRRHLSEEVPPETVQAMADDETWPEHADQFFRGCAEAAPALASSSASGSSSASKPAGWAMSASKDELRKAGFGSW